MGRTIEDIIGAESDPATIKRQTLFNLKQYAIQQGWKASMEYTSHTLPQSEYIVALAGMAQAITTEINEDLVAALVILEPAGEVVHEAKPS